MFHDKSRDLPDPPDLYGLNWMDGGGDTPVVRILAICAALWVLVIGSACIFLALA